MPTEQYVVPIDLQAAIAADDKFFLEKGFPRLRGHQLIVDAARRVANPDRRAAITALLQWSDDEAKGMTIPDYGVDDILFAALGITEDDDE